MIDPEKDPEGYARYMKERAEKRKLEQKEQRMKQDTDARLKSLKEGVPQELKVGLQVMVIGLQKNPEKNGSLGTLQSYVAEKERWAVEFRNGSQNNFKAENLQVVDDGSSKAEVADEKDEDIPTAKVYVSNLSADTTADHLTKLFSGSGLIAREPVRNAKGKSKGYEDEWPFAVKLYKPGTEGGDACVEFVNKFSAKAAIKSLQGHVLRGATINVSYAGGGPIGGEVKTKSRDRSRSRERLAQLAELQKSLVDKQRPPELAGIFG